MSERGQRHHDQDQADSVLLAQSLDDTACKTRCEALKKTEDGGGKSLRDLCHTGKHGSSSILSQTHHALGQLHNCVVSDGLISSGQATLCDVDLIKLGTAKICRNVKKKEKKIRQETRKGRRKR